MVWRPPHPDTANCPNPVDISAWGDSHPREACGCTPNTVRVHGEYDERQKRWFYTATCRQCGQYNSRVSATLFGSMVKTADNHARHGTAKGWGKIKYANR